MSELGFVYALKHPETGEVRYVGSTASPNERLRSHIGGNTGSTVEWISRLKDDGLTPEMEILQTCEREDMHSVETEEIMKYQDSCDLLNAEHTGRGKDWVSPDLKGETTTYQFEILKQEWEEWKATLDRGDSIQTHLRSLIRKDTRKNKTKQD